MCREFAFLGGPAPQQLALLPLQNPPLQDLGQTPRPKSCGALEFAKPLPSEPEKIRPGWSVKTLKPGVDVDWLLETGYAMGVRTWTSS